MADRAARGPCPSIAPPPKSLRRKCLRYAGWANRLPPSWGRTLRRMVSARVRSNSRVLPSRNLDVRVRETRPASQAQIVAERRDAGDPVEREALVSASPTLAREPRARRLRAIRERRSKRSNSCLRRSGHPRTCRTRLRPTKAPTAQAVCTSRLGRICACRDCTGHFSFSRTEIGILIELLSSALFFPQRSIRGHSRTNNRWFTGNDPYQSSAP